MSIEKPIWIIKGYLSAIVAVGLLAGVASGFLLIVTQKNFRANSDLLVVQNQQGFSDYYALSKSADYLTGVLIESIYSEKFLEEINNTKLITTEFLPNSKLKRLETWSKVVKVNKNPNAGILSITVFADNQKQVVEISNAILTVLSTKSSLFLGQGQNIDMRILSGPIYEKNPTMTNIFLVTAGGFVVGILLMLLWIFYKAEFGNYQNIVSLNSLERNLSLEEETERNAMEYWNRKMNG